MRYSIFSNVNIKFVGIQRNCFVSICCLSSAPLPHSLYVHLCLLIKCEAVCCAQSEHKDNQTKNTIYSAHTHTHTHTHSPRSKRYNKLIYRLHALTIWVFELRDKSCSNTNTRAHALDTKNSSSCFQAFSLIKSCALWIISGSQSSCINYVLWILSAKARRTYAHSNTHLHEERMRAQTPTLRQWKWCILMDLDLFVPVNAAVLIDLTSSSL